MQTLDDIACLYGTDKSSLGHDYCRTYDALLSPMRERPITLMEIGVWEGASIAMWREYFSRGLIVGVDVDTSRVRGDYIEGTHIRQGDATNDLFLRSVVADFDVFDVIIDDGSHMADQASRTFAALWPYVADGGLYIVEDIHTYFWARANPTGAEAWLFELSRDAIGRGVDRADPQSERKLSSVASVQFYESLAVIIKK